MYDDKTLKEAVEKYDDSDKNYKAILYVCLEGGAGDIMAAASAGMAIARVLGGVVGGGVSGALGALSNDFAIMTVYTDYICFYILKKLDFKFTITNKIVLPYEAIIKIKTSKFLIWNNLKIHFINNHKKHKLKVMISDKTVGIKEQKENVKILLDYLKTKGFKK